MPDGEVRSTLAVDQLDARTTGRSGTADGYSACAVKYERRIHG